MSPARYMCSVPDLPVSENLAREPAVELPISDIFAGPKYCQSHMFW